VKTKIWITVAFLVTFVFGFIAGYLVPREPLPTPRNQWAQNRGQDRDDYREREVRERRRLAEELDLSTEQREAVEQLTLEFSQRVRRTLQEANVATRERVSAQHDSLSVKMRVVLNDKQFEKWEKHHQRRMEMLQRRGR
jgi:CBS-domain-containing membrane protein